MGGKGSVNNPDDVTRKSSPSVTDETEYDEISEIKEIGEIEEISETDDTASLK